AGLAAVLAGTVPWGTLWMGLVSNGGAAGVMVLTGYWRRAVLGLAFFYAMTAGFAAAAVIFAAGAT
ncbi:MAG: hypothetical protein AAGF60_13910, partial [Pseudomonadota bacterium]